MDEEKPKERIPAEVIIDALDLPKCQAMRRLERMKINKKKEEFVSEIEKLADEFAKRIDMIADDVERVMY
jgi:hypothetical protein